MVIMDVYLAAMMGLILSICLPTMISAAPPTVDAPHCRNIGCCSGRDDNCYVPISNSEFGIAVCYCDDFCLRSASSDCCTDFPLLCVQRQIDMGTLFSELWQADDNRIDENQYSYELQSSKRDFKNYTDLSAGSLFTSFNEDHIFNKGTFKSFLPLCGYYEVMQGVSENDTSNYLEQVQTYLDDVMDTRVMTIATRHLKDAGFVSDKTDLREKIKAIWFTRYTRQAANDTSAFEHVFCGELKSTSSASGLHNWITLYREEKDGHLDYHGYTGLSVPNQIGVQYTWYDAIKPRTSVMLGISTEFELAIFHGSVAL
ncbi:uridylate-specific endoribonuclease B-like [Apostichopus japonicus]|uniref:uridylate-specific endoribonuclease B-like n=1 Tax=Stichopus japonicus TaxID=307972 RepID=UPI003AB58A78